MMTVFCAVVDCVVVFIFVIDSLKLSVVAFCGQTHFAPEILKCYLSVTIKPKVFSISPHMAIITTFYGKCKTNNGIEENKLVTIYFQNGFSFF